ncbi:hypothetical protein ACVS3L_002752 [Vibrio vulnificus]
MDEFGFVEFVVDDDALTTIQLLEEEAEIIQLFSHSMFYCEQREIGGKQFAYAPVCKLISIDEEVGTIEFKDGAMWFTPESGEPHKLNLVEQDAFVLLGFITSLDNTLSGRLKSYKDKYGFYPAWYNDFNKTKEEKLIAYQELTGNFPVWYKSMASSLLD